MNSSSSHLFTTKFLKITFCVLFYESSYELSNIIIDVLVLVFSN